MALLLEYAKLVRDIQTAPGWAVHLGTSGWFDIYVAKKVSKDGVDEIKELTGADVTKTVMDVKEYDAIRDKIAKLPDRQSAAGVYLNDPVLSYDQGANRTRPLVAASQATNKLAKLGFKRLRMTAVFLDLTGTENWISGGRIGGFADWKNHAVAVHSGSILKSDLRAAEVLTHELAHQYFFYLPKEGKQEFRQWYRDNILGGMEKIATTGLPSQVKEDALTAAWKAFEAKWQESSGFKPSEAKMIRRGAVGPEEFHKFVFERMFFDGYSFVVQMKKRLVLGGSGGKTKVLVKGSRGVEVVPSTGHENPPVVYFAKDGFDKAVPVSQVWDYASVDVEETDKRHPGLNLGMLKHHLDTQAGGGTPGAALTFQHETWVWSAFDAAHTAYRKAVEKSFPLVEVLYVSDNGGAIDKFMEKAKADPDGFDPERNMRIALGHTLEVRQLPGGHEAGSLSQAMQSPAGSPIRMFAKSYLQAPSDYATANPDELWAETVTYAAWMKTALSSEIWALLKRFMQRYL